MLRYLNKIYDYHNHLICFIILFFIWGSINTGSKYLLINLIENNDFRILFNFIRSIIPYIIIIFFFVISRPFLEIFKNFDTILKLFFIYGLAQLSGLFYIGENLHEHYWVVCLFSLLVFFNYIQNKNDEKLLNNILIFNIVFTFSVFIIFLFMMLKNDLFSYNLLYSHVFASKYSLEPMPRSSGISRMALILFIFLNSFYFFYSSKKIKITIFIINMLLVSIIFLMQSRGIILSFFISLFVINLLFNFQSYKKRLVYIFLIISVPILIFATYPSLKNILIEKYGEKAFIYQGIEKFKIKNLEFNIRNDLFNTNPNDTLENKIGRFSTNRYYAWNFLTTAFFEKDLSKNITDILLRETYDLNAFNFKKKYNFLTGYGPQADRYFLLNNNPLYPTMPGPFGAHASNGYIYSLICSGIFGFLFFFLLNLIIFYKILKIFFNNKSIYFNANAYLSTSIITVLFLQFRILFENSYSVFGVDMLLLFSSYLIIANEYKKLKN